MKKYLSPETVRLEVRAQSMVCASPRQGQLRTMQKDNSGEAWS